VIRSLRYLWVFPATVLGLPFVALAWCGGGSARVVQGAIEVEGRWASFFLRRCLLRPAAAMTIGHIILGRDQECLDSTRAHEHVHVRQFERWGPFMIPLYIGHSILLYVRGYDPYFDNPFEVEAYREAC
jgi:hypothetical protein